MIRYDDTFPVTMNRTELNTKQSHGKYLPSDQFLRLYTKSTLYVDITAYDVDFCGAFNIEMDMFLDFNEYANIITTG